MGSIFTYGSISGSIDHGYQIGTEFRITFTSVAFEDLYIQGSPFVNTLYSSVPGSHFTRYHQKVP